MRCCVIQELSHGLAGGVVWKVAELEGGVGGTGGMNGSGAKIVVLEPALLVPGRPEKNFMNICGVKFSIGPGAGSAVVGGGGSDVVGG